MPIVKAVQFTKDEATSSFIGQIEVEHVNASGVLSGNKLDLSSNVDMALKRVEVDEHLTVLHVADRARPSPKLFDPAESMEVDHGADAKRKRKRDDEDDSKMEDRAPSAKRQKKESESATFQDKLYAIEKEAERAMRNGTAKIPDATSLYTVLTQSLKSNDQALFERLLGMQNDEAMQEFEDDMIQNTLDRISAEDALKLLEKLAERFRISPRQSLEILKWMLPLLSSHSASFARNESSRPFLVEIQQTIDYHIKTLLPAMKLQGRLSLMMKQIEKVDRSEKRKEAEATSRGLEKARNTALFVHDDSRAEDDRE